MIVRLVMRARVFDDLLEGLPQIVGVGNQEAAGALGQGAQACLRIRSPHCAMQVVILSIRFRQDPGLSHTPRGLQALLLETPACPIPPGVSRRCCWLSVATCCMAMDDACAVEV